MIIRQKCVEIGPVDLFPRFDDEERRCGMVIMSAAAAVGADRRNDVVAAVRETQSACGGKAGKTLVIILCANVLPECLNAGPLIFGPTRVFCRSASIGETGQQDEKYEKKMPHPLLIGPKINSQRYRIF